MERDKIKNEIKTSGIWGSDNDFDEKKKNIKRIRAEIYENLEKKTNSNSNNKK